MDGLIRKHVPEADMLPDLPIPSAVGTMEVAVDHPLARDERILLVLDKVVAHRTVDKVGDYSHVLLGTQAVFGTDHGPMNT
jgi:hypothetical protein